MYVLIVDRCNICRSAYYGEFGCEEYIVRTMQHAVKAAWGMSVAAVTGLFILFIPKLTQKLKESSNLERDESMFSVTSSRWKGRLV